MRTIGCKTQAKPCQEPISSPTQWRSSDSSSYAPSVKIPRVLALDLVRYLSYSVFVHEASWEECEAGLPKRHSEVHAKRMERLEEVVSIELCDQSIDPTAENMLRALSIAYEGAALLGAVVNQ